MPGMQGMPGGPMPPMGGPMPGQMGGPPMGGPMGVPMGVPMGGAPPQAGYPGYGGAPGAFGQPAANDPMWGCFTSIAGQVRLFGKNTFIKSSMLCKWIQEVPRQVVGGFWTTRGSHTYQYFDSFQHNRINYPNLPQPTTRRR